MTTRVRHRQKSPAVNAENRSGRDFVLALALTALSGATALSHELLWTRRLTDLLGTSVEASARVFGCFFLGLALGSAWGARRAAGITRPWRETAAAEAALALLTLPILLLPQWTAGIWPALGPEDLSGWVGWAVKWGVSLLVVLPPATAMGAILPLLATATLGGQRRLDRHGIWLYAANTLGGVAGLASTVLVVLPALGASGSMLLAMGINLGIAGVLVSIDCARRPTTPPRVIDPAQGAVQPVHRALPSALAFFSGAGVLAAEVIGLELVMLAAPLSFYAPAAVLTAVILALGLAALAVPAMRSRREARGSSLPLLLSTGGIALTVAPLLFMALATVGGPLAGDVPMIGFFVRLVGITSASLGPALLLVGQIFPESLAMSAIGIDTEARRLGQLLAWNGVGGFLGAEAAYRLLLPFCGIHGGMAALGLTYLLVGLGVLLASSPCWELGRPLMRASAALLIWASLTFGLVRHLPHVNPHMGFAVLDQRFRREGSVAVVETPTHARSILLSNQYILGSTDARWDQERQAHLPLLLHAAPRRVAFIGLATGITPGAALDHGAVESVTAVEVSPLVVRAADRWFTDWNHAVTRRANARVVVEDGRTFLASCVGRFDVVVGDLYLPWGPGESRLFSVEHFLAARRALLPGGVFCQWLPMYQLTPDQFELILSSFRSAFPHVHLIRNGFGTQRPTIALVGFRDSDLNWDVIDRRFRESRTGSAILDPVARHPESIAMLYAGRVIQPYDSDTLNTLGNLRLELEAGRVRVSQNPGGKYLHGERWLGWLNDQLARTWGDGDSGDVDDPARQRRFAMMRLGSRISAWEQSRPRDLSKSGSRHLRLPAALTEDLPNELRDDSGADWSRWPGLPPLPRR